MWVATAEEMRRLDQAAINEFGLPGPVLMENAGRQVADAVRKLTGELKGRVITVFAGKGNNGGDGLVAARHLINQGAEVKVMLLVAPEEVTGDARLNLDIWRKMGQKVYSLHQGDAINIVRLVLMNTDLIVDAIYGTGFKGKVGSRVGQVIDLLNASRKAIVSVDIPSGLEADTGRVPGPCIRATQTVTFGLPKLGLLLEPAVDYVGEVKVADISIPAVLVEREGLRRRLLTPELVKSWLGSRPPAAHKGDFGRVLVVAGSRGMLGAACLAGNGAARGGAGLVTVAVPESLASVAAAKLTEVMVLPLPDGGTGVITRNARQEILAFLEKCDVLAIGPGLSTVLESTALVRELVVAVKVPCVVDADGLNALVGDTGILRKAQAPLVLTPHPGEMARLLDTTTRKVQENRLEAAETAAADWQAVVLLKGARTIVAAPDGQAYLNLTGNPGMATGGSGDVLTGLVAGLLAQGLAPARAAAAAAYLHGLAGDIAARARGMMGLVAGDILDALPLAARELETGEGL